MGVCSVTSVVSDSLRPYDSSLLGSFVHGILHARILGQVAIFYSRASSQPRNRTHVSRVSCCLYLCIYLKVELLDHMVILCLLFWGAAILFSTAAAPFYIPTNRVYRVPVTPCPRQYLLYPVFPAQPPCWVWGGMSRWFLPRFQGPDVYVLHLQMS